MEEVPRRTSLVPLAFPCFVLCLIVVETEGLLDYQGHAGIISIVRWNLRPVIFGVEKGRFCKRTVLANVPSFRFWEGPSFPFLYPRSGFGVRRSFFCVPTFRLWGHPFANPRYVNGQKRHLCERWGSGLLLLGLFFAPAPSSELKESENQKIKSWRLRNDLCAYTSPAQII